MDPVFLTQRTSQLRVHAHKSVCHWSCDYSSI